MLSPAAGVWRLAQPADGRAARRVGQAPCRLFVALLRDRRWEVITQADEDQARALLRAQRDGPCLRVVQTEEATRPTVPLSDDARFVLLAEQILRQAGWRGELFLGVKLHDPTWPRVRWEHAQTELTWWRLQQGQARRRGSGLEPLGAPWADGEDTEVVFSMWRYAVREAHNTLFERR